MRVICTILLSLPLIGCIEPYILPDISAKKAIVVDASITNEIKNHEIYLTYSSNLISLDSTPVTGAEVYIEKLPSGDQIKMLEQNPGQYFSNRSWGAEYNQTYILHINVGGDNQYFSTQESLPAAARIDSLFGRYMTFQSTEDISNETGIQFLINSSSDSTEKISLRYEWEETFQIVVPYESLYEWNYNKATPVKRNIPVGTCYRTNTSQTLTLATAEGLTSNMIREVPLQFASEYGTRMLSRYSLLVKQFALSSTAYDYYKDLKENNEGAGSLSDRQKGTITGNILSETESAIPILGFFEVAHVTEKRAFFGPEDFEAEGFAPVFPCDYNELSDTLDHQAILVEHQIYGSTMSIVDSIPPIWPKQIPDWIRLPPKCSDCTYYGDLKKPDFWID